MEKFYQVSLVVTGIKKRCRKIETQIFKLQDIPVDGRNDQALIDGIKINAREVIDRHMKELSSRAPYLSFTYGERKGDWVELHIMGTDNFRVEV